MNSYLFLVYTLLFSIFLNAQIDSPQEIQMEQTIQDIGDVTHLAMPLSIILTTIIIDDKKGTWQFVKSFGTSLAFTYALKYAINKPRPEGAKDGHAFPSGHTSVAFHSASFIQQRYGWKYGVPSYILASFVAYSRLEGLNDRHDQWDVLGGIIVGLGSTYLFTTMYQKKHFELTYSNQNNNFLIGIKYKF